MFFYDAQGFGPKHGVSTLTLKAYRKKDERKKKEHNCVGGAPQPSLFSACTFSAFCPPGRVKDTFCSRPCLCLSPSPLSSPLLPPLFPTHTLLRGCGSLFFFFDPHQQVLWLLSHLRLYVPHTRAMCISVVCAAGLQVSEPFILNQIPCPELLAASYCQCSIEGFFFLPPLVFHST